MKRVKVTMSDINAGPGKVVVTIELDGEQIISEEVQLSEIELNLCIMRVRPVGVFQCLR